LPAKPWQKLTRVAQPLLPYVHENLLELSGSPQSLCEYLLGRKRI
jgi:hypothetical protein